jgi:radical SAM protein with 4Fe4S-binding SPASM domain
VILGYHQAVSDQNLVKGIEIAKHIKIPEIQAVLETELERRQELVQSAQDAEPAQKVCSFYKEFQKKNCGKCKIKFYCSRECQAQDWTIHKLACEKK